MWQCDRLRGTVAGVLHEISQRPLLGSTTSSFFPLPPSPYCASHWSSIGGSTLGDVSIVVSPLTAAIHGCPLGLEVEVKLHNMKPFNRLKMAMGIKYPLTRRQQIRWAKIWV